jgi:cellulose synthase/poly-beta-1,6-N-acetylglucosamine synthase-like glycosyltransferase
MIILNTLFILLFAYLSVCVLYAFIFSVAGKLGKVTPSPQNLPPGKFAVFIPSYKEDEVILSSARHAVNQNYPKDRFDIIVIADNLKQETIEQLKAIPVEVIEVKFEKSTKARSLNEAFRRVPENRYDYALILDADNIMASDFISRINGKLKASGVSAIQGHRVAKNHNTNFAVLDGISEEVNNHIYRKGHRVLGLSSGLIGSGMAFDFRMYRDILKTIDAIGGFDKESELKLLKNKIKIEYAEDAIVYDEKVDNSEVFSNQRRRWISAQIHYFRKFFLSGIWHLITKGNIDFFDKALQQMLLPRVLLLGTTGFMATVALIFRLLDLHFLPGAALWSGLFLVCISGILIAVPESYYTRKTLKALLDLPKAMGAMFATLFRLKGANKKFIHTPHKVTDISA